MGHRFRHQPEQHGTGRITHSQAAGADPGHRSGSLRIRLDERQEEDPGPSPAAAESADRGYDEQQRVSGASHRHGGRPPGEHEGNQPELGPAGSIRPRPGADPGDDPGDASDGKEKPRLSRADPHGHGAVGDEDPRPGRRSGAQRRSECSQQNRIAMGRFRRRRARGGRLDRLLSDGQPGKKQDHHEQGQQPQAECPSPTHRERNRGHGQAGHQRGSGDRSFLDAKCQPLEFVGYGPAHEYGQGRVDQAEADVPCTEEGHHRRPPIDHQAEPGKRHHAQRRAEVDTPLRSYAVGEPPAQRCGQRPGDEPDGQRRSESGLGQTQILLHLHRQPTDHEEGEGGQDERARYHDHSGDGRCPGPNVSACDGRYRIS